MIVSRYPDAGIVTRAFDELFRVAQEAPEEITHAFSVSMLEVYNEQIRDLFATKEDAGARYDIKQDELGMWYVSNLRERACQVTEGTRGASPVWEFVRQDHPWVG